ncbi:hypothetical protein RVR_5781 [Actinacidiphila reveromycinica]|uniref:Uncharacterized protein n=1 Tax=Actinacidiphila reveromycinica TaxID=659352 RepID=A0A7U3UUR6_9ACTN|nr:hypothetical protein [Streptomyces sp. SN-593]BBA99242.1 hypothetical protein RVR_5781 [Streptomyces sp. SN-593]
MIEPVSTPLPALPAHYRAAVRRDRAAGRLKKHSARTLMSICDLAERHNRLIPDISKVTAFMGLGELSHVLADPTDGDGDWFFVHEVLKLAGATPELWAEIRDGEIAEAAAEPPVPPRVDEYTVYSGDGTSHQVPVCNWQVAMDIALSGPWGDELMENILPSLRLAAIESGLAEKFETVLLGDDGTVQPGGTLADLIRANGPLPSREVARQQVADGLAGAFHRGNGESS